MSFSQPVDSLGVFVSLISDSDLGLIILGNCYNIVLKKKKIHTFGELDTNGRTEDLIIIGSVSGFYEITLIVLNFGILNVNALEIEHNFSNLVLNSNE